MARFRERAGLAIQITAENGKACESLPLVFLPPIFLLILLQTRVEIENYFPCMRWNSVTQNYPSL